MAVARVSPLPLHQQSPARADRTHSSAGTLYELVARQLGHADVQMVATSYCRHAPRSDERDRWERIASTQDAEQEAQRTQNAESRAKRPQEQGENPTPLGLLWVPHLQTTRANHRYVIGSPIAGAGLEPATPAL
jgi:hypothetical protein